MEIRGLEIRNLDININANECALVDIPGALGQNTYISGIEYFGQLYITNATSVTVANLPSGLTYSTQTDNQNIILTVTGIPNVAGESFAAVANAVNNGDGLCIPTSDSLEIANSTVLGVVTSNLVQYIDVANTKSYPGWGNTVYNLAGNTLNYYLVDAANSYARANANVDYTNGGVLKFDGSNIGRIYATTYDGSNENPIANTGDANWTLETWFKVNSLTNSYASTNKLSVIGEQWGGIFNSDVHHYLTFEKLDGTGSENGLAGGSYSGDYYLTSPRPTIYPGQYYHAAVTCSNGNVRRLYINGTEVANLTTVSSITKASDKQTRIGADIADNNPGTNGIMRGSVAVARYYNKTLSSSEIIRNRNTESGRFIGGSISFNGANSALSTTANLDFAPENGNYTLEFWANTHFASSNGAPQPVYDSTALKVFIENNPTTANTGVLTVVSANTRIASANILNYQNNWSHFAVTRSANVLRIFQNGIMKGYVGSDTSNANANANLNIGNGLIATTWTFNNTAPSGNYYFNGEITNLQWIKGVSLYSNSGYTYPSSPVPPTTDSNVKILLKSTDSECYTVDSSPRTTSFTGSNVSFNTSSPYSNPEYSTILRQVRFDYTGNLQEWTVPDNVSKIQVTATGAKGRDSSGVGKGGNGAAISSIIDVTGGQKLYIVVGGYPTSATTAAYGFGGNAFSGTSNAGPGGGLSGIFISNVPSIANALLVAGGGGGAAGSSNGGSAGVTSPGSGANGAALYGGGGGGGTTSTAGAAGTSSFTQLTEPTAGNGLQGGTGGQVASTSRQGGGGGGGYYGGGGGVGGNGVAATPGGGGGGGTYSSNTITYLPPFNFNGNGVVIINYAGHT